MKDHLPNLQFTGHAKMNIFNLERRGETEYHYAFEDLARSLILGPSQDNNLVVESRETLLIAIAAFDLQGNFPPLSV